MPYVTVDEQRIFYQAHHGDVARRYPPLVCLHGAGGTHLYWPPQLRHTDGFDVYAIDLPGHGRSEGNGRAHIGDYRRVVRGLTTALELRPAVLAGHSMGGAIAMDYALSHPESVAGLVLVGSGARLRVAEDILRGVLNDFKGTARLIADWAHGSAPSERMRQMYVERMLDSRPRVVLDDFRACDEFDIRPQLHRITQPALVICGSNDRLTPAHYSHYLHDHLPNARLLEFEQAGHMVMLEYPEAVTRAIIEFVAAVASSANIRTPPYRLPF